jgi:single-stranded DNA-binding protein
MTSKLAITLYGNVGADPETRTIPGKPITKAIYDEMIDEVVEREFTTSDRELRTFSIAVELPNTHDEKSTRWIHCADWKDLSPLVRKGDRVKVTGRFSERSYEKDGVTKIWREFILETLSIVRHKIRHPAE